GLDHRLAEIFLVREVVMDRWLADADNFRDVGVRAGSVAAFTHQPYRSFDQCLAGITLHCRVAFDQNASANGRRSSSCVQADRCWPTMPRYAWAIAAGDIRQDADVPN